MHSPLRTGLTRRGVLGSLVAAALGVVSFAYPGLARVLTTTSAREQPVPAADTPVLIDPTFTSGEVVGKTTESLLLQSAEGTRTVWIRPGKTIWKEFDVSIDAVELGEWVMAKGEPQPDGSLLGRPGWVWASIGQWSGVITTVRSNGLVAKRHDGLNRSVAFSPRLEVIRADDQKPVSAGVAALAVGTRVGAVGLVLPDRSLRATRVWIDS